MGGNGRRRLAICALGTIAMVGAADASAAPAGPDLVVTSVAVTGASVQAGHPMVVADRVRNAGRRRAGTSTTAYYLSVDRATGPGGRKVGRRAVARLAAGKRSRGESVIVIPADTVPASYFVLACADDARKIREQSEKNNCRATRAPVAVTAPPLTGSSLPTPTPTPANQRPVAGFTFAPSAPQTGQPVTFTSSSADPDGTLASIAWELDGDFDYDDASGPTASRSFADDGSYAVFLRVTDDRGGVDLTGRTVTVTNRPPTGGFTFSPSSPVALQQVDFTATASDPDGTVAGLAWDFDGDLDFDDATGAAAGHTFGAAGTYTVRLRATDDDGAITTVAREVVVAAPANLPPTAEFSWTPANPQAGDRVDFSATASDADGAVASHAWDLDGDLDFDDFTSSAAVRHFHGGGTFQIGLRVTDDDGATDTIFHQVVVSGSPDTDRDDDGNLNGRPGVYDGYDCAPDDPSRYFGAADAPDMSFIDSDCDGVDGRYATSIFVNPGDETAGDNSTCGTGSFGVNPCRTIMHGLLRAGSTGRTVVLVAEGTYEEPISLLAGRSIYGGYASVPAENSSRARFASRHATTLLNRSTGPNGLIGVNAVNITSSSPVTLQNLTIRTGNAAGTGRSNYGVYARDAAGLTLQAVDVEAGSAAPGAGGALGSAGPDGPPGAGGLPGSCPRPSGGTGGTGGSGGLLSSGGDDISGGRGGDGGSRASTPDPDVTNVARGNPGNAGQPAVGNQTAGVGGSAFGTGLDGGQGGNGGSGAAGANGPGATAAAGAVVASFWVAAVGVSGSTGTNGSGGGGGGGGAIITDYDDRGNGGGGGGAGAGGGTGGGGASGGGGSFGLFALNSGAGPGPVLLDVRISSGAGGRGGTGGMGGRGGTGGPGGYGGRACLHRVGAGGDGGRGGDGGDGGHGGGGAGGASIAFFRSNVTSGVPPGVQLVPGPGGPGGESLGNSGVNGASLASN